MGRFEAASQALPALLAQIGTGWPGSDWEWDDRLTCALSTVATAQAPQVQATLTAVLPSSSSRLISVASVNRGGGSVKCWVAFTLSSAGLSPSFRGGSRLSSSLSASSSEVS
jgi:hypothetical protein